MIPSQSGKRGDVSERQKSDPSIYWWRSLSEMTTRTRATFDDLASERATADKRARYFAGGTVAVWDVISGAQLPSESSRRVISKAQRFSGVAPAVPGWRMKVDDLFR
jgi:hypothetical protein